MLYSIIILITDQQFIIQLISYSYAKTRKASLAYQKHYSALIQL